MACPRTTVLVATLMFLIIPQDCQSYKNWRQGYRNRWPGVFMGSGSDGGAFRPLQSYCSRRGVEFKNGLPLLDIFEEVVGDITKAARELAESRSDTSIRTPRHQVLDGTESVILNVELPGCKKQDVDAHISGDDGDKILRITAVRKKPRNTRNTVPSSGSDDSGNRDEGPPRRTATESSLWTEEIFELSFRLGGNIDVSGVRGKMEDGILMLILPRVPPEPPVEPIDIPIDFPEEGDGGADEEVRRGSKGVEDPYGGREDSIFSTRIRLS